MRLASGRNLVAMNSGLTVGLGKNHVMGGSAREVITRTHMSDFTTSANGFKQSLSSGSKEWPSPPWPTSSSAVRVIQFRISSSRGPPFTSFAIASRSYAHHIRLCHQNCSRWIARPYLMSYAIERRKHVSHVVYMKDWIVSARISILMIAGGVGIHPPGFKIFRCCLCRSPEVQVASEPMDCTSA